jgi:hypothetical protein
VRLGSWAAAVLAAALVVGGCATAEPPPPRSELQMKDNVVRPKKRTMYALPAPLHEPGAGPAAVEVAALPQS